MFVRTYQKKKILFFAAASILLLCALLGRLIYIMAVRGEYYSQMATDLQEREREIKALRGRILDRNGVVLADNETVCTVSVIYNQVEDPERVIEVLCEELELSEEYVRARVEKYSSRERIKSNVPKEVGDRIRGYDLAGVKVDEDYKRYYPYSTLASKVLGFTGSDNQGILGLEAVYDEYLTGESGKILTMTDASGIELQEEGERRIEPVAGQDLVISIDANIQNYAEQLALQAYEAKEAENVMILVMNPNNGEIYACVNVPEFDLNNPYELTEEWAGKLEGGSTEDNLNTMWRNGVISDSYEPGSTFKIITAAAALEEGAVSLEESFYCPGYVVVDDRRIRCARTTGHGAETFITALQNSCNPVFVQIGLRLGVETYYSYFESFGLSTKTGVDLPGESRTIVHQMEDMGNVELATMAFGQGFQITPVQLLTTVSSIINGGTRVTPHFAVKAVDGEEETVFEYPVTEGIVSEETSAVMRELLESVVSEGGGKNGQVEGYRVGGKTATSQTLPRGNGKYIASFIGFAPADDPQVIAICIITHPQGVYYGGQICAPVIRQLFENILPYLEEENYNKPTEQG
ncbi:MAG: peptidoglycan glycosyltransferase [Lachnospiraceae bacterium]|nr:peptidoglycan glycosyltransferase [Lachnospiraceae bacterium]